MNHIVDRNFKQLDHSLSISIAWLMRALPRSTDRHRHTLSKFSSQTLGKGKEVATILLFNNHTLLKATHYLQLNRQ